MFLPLSTIIAVALTHSVSSVTAATCQNNGNFQTSDANTLANQIQTNSIPGQPIDSSLLIKAGHSTKFASNEANSNSGPIFCLNNDFAFDNTHDSLSDIALAATDIVSQCCTGGTCTGGTFQVKGDTGLATDVVLQIGTNLCINEKRGGSNTFSDIVDGINKAIDAVADQVFEDPLEPFRRRHRRRARRDGNGV